MMKHKQVGKKRLYLSYTSVSVFSIKGSQDRNFNRAVQRREELMQKPWSDAAYWIAHYGLLNLLSYKAQNYQPRADATHNGWALPLSITI